MFDSIRRTAQRLKASKSGNAALLVALGLPVLIGSSGLAVDVSQWYMWKQELQFAADQAALAGARRAYDTLDGLDALRNATRLGVWLTQSRPGGATLPPAR